jgi:thiamine-monophosphate kinase
VEGIHFDFSYASPEQVGWKALAVNLSDIAAMGGKPLSALISLVIPKRINETTIVKIYQGIRDCSEWAKVDVVGGNISRGTSDFVIDVTVIGEASKAILRSGAKEGDCVAITGTPGLSAAGLEGLKKWGKGAMKKYSEASEHHLKPQPRLELAQKLSRMGVTSLIDISDGLSSELNHIAKESNLGIEIEKRLLPIHSQVKALAQKLEKDSFDWILHGGEEYELLMTFPISRFSALSALAAQMGVPFTRIGYTVSSPRKIMIRDTGGKPKELVQRGWTHF